MTIQVRFFASLTDITKADLLLLEIPNDSDIDSLRKILIERFPEFGNYGDSIRFAANMEYSFGDRKINSNDVVALIPPTSGG